MFDAITELFLHTYFLFDAVAGKLMRGTEILFDKLYSAFLLPQTERAKLFAATQTEVVREIKSYGDYAQVCRIQKFSALTEGENISAESYEMIAIKGGALKQIKQMGFDECIESTEAAICKFLNETANMGVVPSLCMLGFLQCEGIFVTKSEALGRKHLNKAATWNSLEGILLALAYEDGDRQKNMNRLYTVTKGTLYESMSDRAQRAYALPDGKSIFENKLLKKAFGAGILRTEVYDSQYARFIFSDVLSAKDKEHTLFSSHKEVISEMADLPLKLNCGALAFDARELGNFPLVRKKEQDIICSMIACADMREDVSFRPLCVSGDSEYLLGLYMSAIGKAFPSAHIERIDVADLGDYDFEPTKNHIFVRSCEEDKQNVFFLLCKGEIREDIFNMVKNFLQSDKRKKFRLLHPSAVLDMSAILPICFCDRHNARLLKACCDVVTLAPVSEAEKQGMLSFILQEKAKKYKLSDLQLDGSAKALLLTYSIDRAESLLDRAVCYHRGRSSIEVTAALLKEIANGDMGIKNKFGFGSAGNENK